MGTQYLALTEHGDQDLRNVIKELTTEINTYKNKYETLKTSNVNNTLRLASDVEILKEFKHRFALTYLGNMQIHPLLNTIGIPLLKEYLLDMGYRLQRIPGKH